MKLLSMWHEKGSSKYSFARISSTIVLASWLAWVSFIVFNTKALPPGMWEISTVVGVLYGLNKTTAAVTTVSTRTTIPAASTTETVTTKAS